MIANNLKPYRPTHPGEVLKDELEYRGISQRGLAKKIGISYSAFNSNIFAALPQYSNCGFRVLLPRQGRFLLSSFYGNHDKTRQNCLHSMVRGRVQRNGMMHPCWWKLMVTRKSLHNNLKRPQKPWLLIQNKGHDACFSWLLQTLKSGRKRRKA